MTLLPIVERELRTAARQRSTYWARLGLPLAAIFVAGVIFMLTFGLLPTQTGRYVFEGLAWIMFVYCLAYGRRATADCLSQEKREGTLGLLFLTDLKGHDVVLGKLVATSVRGFYGLLAMFPVLAIPLLLGGITSGEFWRVVLVLMDTFLFSLAIGILGSALSRDLQRAMAANLLLMLSLMAAPAAYMYAMDYFMPGLHDLSCLLFSCPAYAFYLCDETRYLTASDQFWCSVGVIHGLTWLLILTAGWIVPRSWQERSSQAEEQSPWRELWHAWRHGPVAGKSEFRQQTLDTNAFYWLAARARFKPVHVWTFLACMAVWWLVGWLAIGRLWLDPSVAILTAVLLNFTFKVWLAIEAGQQLAEDARTGAFEVLLSVPLTVQDIVRGQLLALRRQFLWPLLAVLGIELLFLLALRRSAWGWSDQACWLAGMFMLVVDLVALSWVGMWRALIAKSHNLATIGTLLRMLLLPWLLFGMVVGVGKVWYALARGEDWSPTWQFHLALWLGVGLAADLVFGLTAWWQLRTRFRKLAFRQFNPTPSSKACWFGVERAEHPSPQGATASNRVGRLNEPQRRDEPREDKASGISALLASLRLSLPWGNPRARLAISGCLALVAIYFGFLALRSHFRSAPVIVLSANQTNAPVQVCSSPGGVLLVLPDGSLWRWGRLGNAASSLTAVPARVGTNSNWARAAVAHNHLVAVRRDGSLWEWSGRGGNARNLPASGIELERLDSNHDWVGVATTANHSVALRSNGTLWAWGDNRQGELGIVPESQLTDSVQANTANGQRLHAPYGRRMFYTQPVQVGTNKDWAAVCCPWNSAMALRRDGTLWAWGPIMLQGTWGLTTSVLPLPTQVCLESNWTGFISSGFMPLVRNRSGELWEPFHAAPNPQTSASSSFRLVTSSALPGRFASAWCGEPRIFETRTDGTLWQRTQPLSSSPRTPVGAWRRLGRRSDWVALWGTGGTALGLTQDGTLWTWGIDLGRDQAPDFMSRLKLAQSRFMTLFGPAPRPTGPSSTPAYREQPWPLIRLVLTNSVH